MTFISLIVLVGCFVAVYKMRARGVSRLWAFGIPIAVFAVWGQMPWVKADVAAMKAEREVSSAERDAKLIALAKGTFTREVTLAKTPYLASRLGGFHGANAQTQCGGAYDGSAFFVVEAVKGQLNDPDSFEHVETGFGGVRPDGTQRVSMVYRAKNGFNATVTETAEAFIHNGDCSVERIL
jgi:hypothetical protein